MQGGWAVLEEGRGEIEDEAQRIDHSAMRYGILGDGDHPSSSPLLTNQSLMIHYAWRYRSQSALRTETANFISPLPHICKFT